MKNANIERSWVHHGLSCEVVLVEFSVADGHRCGYVAVPDTHPWHGVGYDDPVSTQPIDNSEFTIEDVGVIPAFLRGISPPEDQARRDASPAFQIAVHGGITFSGERPDSPGWWFGFDCAHDRDTLDEWTHDRVSQEVERMAEQIAAVKP